MLYASVALLMVALAVGRAVLMRGTVFARRGCRAMVLHGAEADCHGSERSQRHESQHEKHDGGLETVAHANDASTRASTPSTCTRRAAGDTGFQTFENRALGPLVAMAVL